MAHIYIEQPNGLFGIFSTVIDDFVSLNCTKEFIIILERLSESNRTIPSVSKYFSSFEVVLEHIEEIHGKKICK